MKLLQSTLTSTLVTTSYAHARYLKSLPNGGARTDPYTIDAVGHVNPEAGPEGGGPRNQFGKDFADAKYEWTIALCLADSDGDGYTNGEEMGDPCCTFRVGEKVQLEWRHTYLSNPGDANSVPKNKAQCVVEFVNGDNSSMIRGDEH